MERPRWDEEQISKQKEMIKSRDMQFHNLYKQVIENKRNIKKCMDILEEIKEKK